MSRTTGAVNLMNNEELVINPATEEKQDDIISAVGMGSNFWYQVTQGNVPGVRNSGMIGDNPSIGTDEETIWNVGGKYEYLTANTTLYVSSSSASDTGIYGVYGMTDDYTEATAIATLQGQTQVALSAQLFRIFNIFIISSPNDNQGDIYVTPEIGVTAGVPDDLTKVKIKMPVGDNIAANGTFTIPNAYKGYMIQLQNTVSKGKDAQVIVRFRLFGRNVFTKATKAEIYQSTHDFGQEVGFSLPTKADVEFTAKSNDIDAAVTGIARIILISTT